MYYIYGVSVPSLLIESTDSMMISMLNSLVCVRAFFWGGGGTSILSLKTMGWKVVTSTDSSLYMQYIEHKRV